jgi:LysM repeat protein
VRQPTGWVAYTVQQGDNLTFLAQRGGITINEIIEVNCLDESGAIVIGTELFVPESSTQTDIPLQTCSNEVPAGWELYTIVAGDNLSRLALETGTTLDEIMTVNCLDSESVDTIVIGDQLYLPAAAE